MNTQTDSPTGQQRNQIYEFIDDILASGFVTGAPARAFLWLIGDLAFYDKDVYMLLASWKEASTEPARKAVVDDLYCMLKEKHTCCSACDNSLERLISERA